MKRELTHIANSIFDLIVIGGGITGAFAAWDAALRGLSVALVEKGDFGAATSAASGKIIHGGIRYMQYGAFSRVRQSLHERMVFRRIAPQFVQPIPFLIPTFGHLLKGKEILKAGMTFFELLSAGTRNPGDPTQKIPRHRMLSRKQVIELEPGLASSNLNGGVLYYDCQMHHPERLTLSILLAAAAAGAKPVNYVEAIDFVKAGRRIQALKVKDLISGNKFEIRGHVFLNAAGPWSMDLLSSFTRNESPFKIRYSKGIHVVTRPITANVAIAIDSKHQSAEALIQRGGRHFFIIPWRNHSLIGTTNVTYYGSPDGQMVTEEDIADFIQEINTVYPAGQLRRQDVFHQYGGLYLDDEKQTFEQGYQGCREDQVVDHEKSDGIQNLITSLCVKYTMARKLAQASVDQVFQKLGHSPPACKTEKTPVYGGDIERFQDYLRDETSRHSRILRKEIIQNLILNYGNRYSQLLTDYQQDKQGCEIIHETRPLIKTQIIHAVREEMALKLSDVVFRRTGIGTIGNPGELCLESCAEIMSNELRWDFSRVQQELTEVKEAFLPVCN